MDKLKLIILVLPFWLIFYSAIPPFQTPDEQGHYNFVQSLADLNYPSFPKAEKKCDSSEVRDVTNYYEGNKIPFNEQRIVGKTNIIPNQKYFEEINCTAQANHPPLYYATSAIFYKTATILDFFGTTRFYFTRLSSLVFYIIFIIFAYKSFSLLFSRKTSLFLSITVGIQPTILMLAVGINPEIAAVSLATASFYFIIKYLKAGAFTYRNILFLALLSAGAVLSKLTGAIVIPFFLFSILISNSKVVTSIKKTLVYLFLMLFFISPWLLLNWKVNSKLALDNLDFIYPKNLRAPISHKEMVIGVLKDFRNAFLTIPGRIGWLDTPLFSFLAGSEVIVLFFSFIIGIFATLKAGIKTVTGKILSASIVFVLAVLIFNLYLAISMQLKLGIGGLQGRYFIIGTVPFLIVTTYGLAKLVRVSDETTSKVILNISILIYFIFVLFNFIPRYYV